MEKCVMVEYVWLDGVGEIRSKTRVLPISTVKEEKIPVWNYDGSSTYQRHTSDSEVKINPKKQYVDPIRGSPHCIVLCETNDRACTRTLARKIFQAAEPYQPMFGLEQEFFIRHLEKEHTFGIDLPSYENSYCSMGAQKCFAGLFIEKVMKDALSCGIHLTGFNWEVAPGQAEFQVCSYGLEAADDLILLRYILQKRGEEYNYEILLHPKLIEGWNGSGLHANFSTQSMREKGGLEVIMETLVKLEKTHTADQKLFGEDNQLRLTGKCETSDYKNFTWGIASRDTSIRIPQETDEKGYGYFEDRRPGANANPYLVTANLFKVACLDGISLSESHSYIIPKSKEELNFKLGVK